MKKILFLLCLILCLVSCGPLGRCDYKSTITYKLDGVSHTESILMEDIQEYSVPSYSCSPKGLQIIAVNGPYITYRKTIYTGNLPIEVEKFEYKTLRTYKVSAWSGKEIKK